MPPSDDRAHPEAWRRTIGRNLIKDDLPRFLDAKTWINAVLTAFMAFMAVRIAWADDLFATSPAFDLMARLATEPVWAVGFAVAALIGLTGSITRLSIVRFLCTSLLLSAHLTFAGFLFEGGGTVLPASLAGYAILAAFMLFRRWHDGT